MSLGIVNAKSGKSVINQMTSQELKSLSEIVKALKKHIKDFNRFHANAVYQHVYDAGDATIRELNEYNDAKSRTKAGEGINNFVFWNQIRPAYASPRRNTRPSREKSMMSNLQIIEELCAIVELQTKIIKAQSDSLAQLGAEVMEDEIAEAEERASRLCQDDG